MQAAMTSANKQKNDMKKGNYEMEKNKKDKTH